jgi:hypothetical protein
MLLTALAWSGHCPPREGRGGAGDQDAGVRAGTDGPDAGTGSGRADADAGPLELAFEHSPLSFLAPGERVVMQVRVDPQLAGALRWDIRPSGLAGDAVVERTDGAELVFRGASRIGSKGSRQPNPALEYMITARLEGHEGLAASSRLTQDEIDVLRQEYVDYGTAFLPQRNQLGAVQHAGLNTGNYTVVAEEVPGTLDRLLEDLTTQVNQILTARGLGGDFEVEDCVTSSFRNPQRNRAVGSVALNSRHVRGRALDCDPRAHPIVGISSQDMMCLVEEAGNQVVGPGGNAFTEKGAAVFLECDAPAADHVHVQR